MVLKRITLSTKAELLEELTKLEADSDLRTVPSQEPWANAQ